MIKSIKLNKLEENYKASDSEMSFRQYVVNEAANDPNFFRWLFDEDFDNDFDSSLSDEQRDEYSEFLSHIN